SITVVSGKVWAEDSEMGQLERESDRVLGWASFGYKTQVYFLGLHETVHSTGKLPMGLSRANLRDFDARIAKDNAIYFQIRNQIAEKKFSHLCSQCCPVALRDTLEEEEEQGKR